jgi:GDPmannose 4,6-dehydratase
MPSALIAGISGQDGYYLSELLISKGYSVFGIVYESNATRDAQIKNEVPGLELIHGDLTDTASLFRSSSEMFGKAQETPQKETTLLWPRSPYGVAKVFGHHMTINYRESYGFHASSGILFNHESPRRGPEFVTRKVSQAVARIVNGKQEKLVMGNLDAQRDWGFAGDYIKAMWLMLQQDIADDYVIATGKTHSVRDLVATAFAAGGINNWEDYVSSSPDLLRPADIASLVGDPSKAKERLGWVPETSFEELVAMMVEHDLKQESKT